jgi:transaldolase
MRIFIDSARLDEIEQSYSFGIIDGVTTNPSLLKKAVLKLQELGKKITIEEYIRKILLTAKGTPVSLEVTDYTADGMIKQAKKLYKMFNPVANNVYIKIPINPSLNEDEERVFDGIKTIKTLSNIGIPVNCTLIFTPEQALLAAKAGAEFVSPFAGRIDDYIRNINNISFEKNDYYPAEGQEIKDDVLDDNGIVSGIDLIGQIIEVYRNYSIKTKVLAASIRNVRQTREAALVGADIATLPFGVIRELLIHFKTNEGMKKFTDDIVPEYAELMK